MESPLVRGTNATPSPEEVWELYQLIGGFQVSQAIYVVAKLGIADLLADGPQGSDALARATGTNESALYRVLRFLVGIGLFEEVAPRHFALTGLGAGLRTDVPGSLRPNVLMILDEPKWGPWGQLLYSVRTGEIAFDRVHGVGLFDYFRAHPENAATFDAAMTSNTARSGPEITGAYDFSGIHRLVDVGGGHGLLLATILQAHLGMRGVLFDLPDVITGAPALLAEAGVAERCEIVPGDFFTAVPPGDAYILRQIIHDWDDIRATAILANCRRAMQGAGKVLVVERAIGSDYRQALQVLYVDLEMLVSMGGLQRTEEEYAMLFNAAGLRLSAVVRLGEHFSIYEGIPA
ncbi:MAG: acetylserotonin O-methyltransferase [Chloroflexota bacterium]|nr:acetylserotonin O-methyltransferase [Chloroflexota bacterium]